MELLWTVKFVKNPYLFSKEFQMRDFLLGIF